MDTHETQTDNRGVKSLTAPELAYFWGVSTKTLDRHVNAGMPCSRRGRHRTFNKESVAWLQRKMIEQQQAAKGVGDARQRYAEARASLKELELENQRLDVAERRCDLVSVALTSRLHTEALLAIRTGIYNLCGALAPRIKGLPTPEVYTLWRFELDRLFTHLAAELSGRPAPPVVADLDLENPAAKRKLSDFLHELITGLDVANLQVSREYVTAGDTEQQRRLQELMETAQAEALAEACKRSQLTIDL